MKKLSNDRIKFLVCKRAMLLNILKMSYIAAYKTETKSRVFREKAIKGYRENVEYLVFKVNQIDTKLKTTRFKRGLNYKQNLKPHYTPY